MRTHQVARIALVWLLLPPLASAARAQRTTQDTTKLATALRTARAAYATALGALNAAQVVEHFADSAVIVYSVNAEFGDEVFTGKPAIVDFLTEASSVSALRFGPPGFTISPTEVTETSTYVVVLEDGSERPGTNTFVWRQQADGTWKVIRATVK